LNYTRGDAIVAINRGRVKALSIPGQQ